MDSDFSALYIFAAVFIFLAVVLGPLDPFTGWFALGTAVLLAIGATVSNAMQDRERNRP
jgi:hypothetical protein